MTGPERQFWVNTVSLDHAVAAIRGGFTQADHGANTRLRRVRVGDGMVFYSHRTALQDPESASLRGRLGAELD
jgi:hypothetical protein